MKDETKKQIDEAYELAAELVQLVTDISDCKGLNLFESIFRFRLVKLINEEILILKQEIERLQKQVEE